MRKKVIRITLTLTDGKEVFTAQGDNRVRSTGLAVSAVITHGNGAISPTAQITITGLSIDKMNKLFRVQWNTMKALLNTVRVEVGEQGGELEDAYSGNITFATINFDSSPDVSLVITSQMAVVDKMTIAEPLILAKGEEADVADIVRMRAAASDYKFENYGVSHIVTDTTINGSNIEIIQKLSTMCNFDLYIDQKLIVICKKGGSRPVKVPIISPTTGLDGYPSPDQRGIAFNCAYSPLIKFGGNVTIKDSLVAVANAEWRIYGLITTLEANKPQGRWHCAVNATWRDSKDAAIQRK